MSDHHAIPQHHLFKNLIGRKFGRLTVTEFVGRKSHSAIWRCKCECGTECEVRGDKIANGETRSCGCMRADSNRAKNMTHGQSRTRLYGVYSAMIARCENPNVATFDCYGGRGIRVCDRWRNSFDAFCDDVGIRPAGATIERINNDGHYCPENVRWATRKEQARNRRSSRIVTFDDQTKTLAEWMEIFGLHQQAAMKRLGIARPRRRRVG